MLLTFTYGLKIRYHLSINFNAEDVCERESRHILNRKAVVVLEIMPQKLL